MGCTGCGLIDEISEIRIAPSGTFGGPRLDFGLDDTVGAPVYCDGDGEIRTPPSHTSAIFVNSDAAGGLDHDLNASGFPSATETVATLAIGNDSDRAAVAVVHFVTKYNVYVSQFGLSGLALFSDLLIDGVGYRFARAIAYADSIPENPEVPGSAGGVPYSIEEYISESYTFSIPAGLLVNLELTQTVDVTGRTGLCNFDGYAGALRALVTTR